MLPAAMAMVAIMVIITTSLLKNTDFAIESEYKEDNRIKSNSLARTGLEKYYLSSEKSSVSIRKYGYTVLLSSKNRWNRWNRKL